MPTFKYESTVLNGFRRFLLLCERGRSGAGVGVADEMRRPTADPPSCSLSPSPSHSVVFCGIMGQLLLQFALDQHTETGGI